MNITLAHPRRLLLAALLLGVLANLLFYGQAAVGISVVLFVGIGLALLGYLSLREQRPPRRANLWLVAAALLFAACMALRDSAVLGFFNFMAVVGLLWLLVASYRSESLAKLTLFQTIANLLVALLEICMRAIPLGLASAKGLNIKQTQMGRFVPLLRGLLLAAPVVLVFTALLAAADSVFSSYVTDLFRFDIPFDTSDLMGRLMFTGLVAWLCAGGLLAAIDAGTPRVPHPERPAEGVTQPLTPPAPFLRLGMVEALTVLLAVDLLFFVFMLVQGAYFFGGLDTLQRTGMTYADYARRGFFELVAVACLALALLLGLAFLTQRTERRQRLAYNLANGLMIVLLLGLLASAFQRMWLYEIAYGFTELRVYTHSFMIWLAVVLLLFLGLLLRGSLRSFAFGTFVAVLVYLAALNIANPDALIARENIRRFQNGAELDAYYLTYLSSDATPTIAAMWPTLDEESRQAMTPYLRYQLFRNQQIEQSWQSWHLGRMQARSAIEQLGLTPSEEYRSWWE